MRRTTSELKAAFALFSSSRAASRGAAIAFYAVTSLAPVLLIVVAIGGLVFGRDAASGALFRQLNGVLGAQGADFLQKMLAGASDASANYIASAISIVMLIASASGVFLELEEALNALWQTEPRAGIVAMAKQRLMSLLLVIGLSIVLVLSLLVDAVLQALSGTIDAWLPFGNVLLMAMNVFVAVALMTVLFAAIFKLVPARRIQGRELFAGAAVTAVLFEIGKFMIGMYLGSQSAASSLGAAGALLGILLWIYYSAQIFLFGAAFTKAHSEAAEALLPNRTD